MKDLGNEPEEEEHHTDEDIDLGYRVRSTLEREQEAVCLPLSQVSMNWYVLLFSILLPCVTLLSFPFVINLITEQSLIFFNG